jgi:acylphosphatase
MNMENDGKRIRKYLAITGIVQGVGYRFWAMKRARELGLGGFVRNMPDGSVEILLDGPEPFVNRMIELCERGPAWATVRTIEELEARGSFPEEAMNPFRVIS